MFRVGNMNQRYSISDSVRCLLLLLQTSARTTESHSYDRIVLATDTYHGNWMSGPQCLMSTNHTPLITWNSTVRLSIDSRRTLDDLTKQGVESSWTKCGKFLVWSSVSEQYKDLLVDGTKFFRMSQQGKKGFEENIYDRKAEAKGNWMKRYPPDLLKWCRPEALVWYHCTTRFTHYLGLLFYILASPLAALDEACFHCRFV